MRFFVEWSIAADKRLLEQAQFDDLEIAELAARNRASDLAVSEGESIQAVVTNEIGERLICHVQG